MQDYKEKESLMLYNAGFLEDIHLFSFLWLQKMNEEKYEERQARPTDRYDVNGLSKD